MQRQILHMDMDTFFVSVERLFDPSLCGVPVVVGSDNPMGRGVVASASYEARRFGIRSAMPLREAYYLCPRARFVNCTPGAYSEASHAIRALCEEVAPVVEMASVDEAYLDLTGTDRLYGPAGCVADRLQQRIATELRLPVSFGWGENKLLAKVASAYSKPHGLFRVFPGQGRAFLAPLELRRLPGIGPKSAALLGRYGLKQIGDLDRIGERWLGETLGEAGRALYRRARGEDSSPVVPWRAAQSVSREHTYDTDTSRRSEHLATLSFLSERVAAGLRHEGKQARRLTLKLRYSDFQTLTRATTLVASTADDREIFRTAAAALDVLCQRSVPVRLLGVCAGELESGGGWEQLDLFAAPRDEQAGQMAQALDRIRERYGFGSILRARSWESKYTPSPPLSGTVKRCFPGRKKTGNL
ncbi:MAG TPA: DNA polymerase IV [Candidatus Sumerlaeota bacterium]|nr:DNA polymerase IV [Candidatus Sumerlaeota bacterium]